MASYDFTGKVALVTGGASGIGKACAHTLAKSGAKLVISDVAEDEAKAVVQTIEQGGGKASFVEADVSKPEQVEAMVAHAVSTFGKLDLAVNNAGIGGESKLIAEYALESWHEVIAVNLNSVFYCLKYELPAMLDAGGGAVVNMASILGSVGMAQSSAYVAAKHGVVGLTKNAALEYSKQGVRVNAVGPGFIETPLLEDNLDADTKETLTGMHPIGRMGKAQEVANLVAFLCSDDASFVTGSYYTVDGAYTAQ